MRQPNRDPFTTKKIYRYHKINLIIWLPWFLLRCCQRCWWTSQQSRSSCRLQQKINKTNNQRETKKRKNDACLSWHGLNERRGHLSLLWTLGIINQNRIICGYLRSFACAVCEWYDLKDVIKHIKDTNQRSLSSCYKKKKDVECLSRQGYSLW